MRFNSIAPISVCAKPLPRDWSDSLSFPVSILPICLSVRKVLGLIYPVTNYNFPTDLLLISLHFYLNRLGLKSVLTIRLPWSLRPRIYRVHNLRFLYSCITRDATPALCENNLLFSARMVRPPWRVSITWGSPSCGAFFTPRNWSDHIRCRCSLTTSQQTLTHCCLALSRAEPK